MISFFRQHADVWDFVKNSNMMMASGFTAAVFGFVSFLFMSRELGPAGLGVFALIQSYVWIVDRLANFQLWDTLIKFMTEAREAKDTNRTKQFIKLGLMLDFGSAFFAYIFALSLLPVFVHLLGWSDEVRQLIPIFALMMLFNFSGTWVSVLRVYNAFKYHALQQIMVSVVRLCAVIVAVFYDARLETFVWIWALTEILGQLLLSIFGYRVLVREVLSDFWRVDLHGFVKTQKQFWSYLFYNHMTSSLRILRELDVIVVNAILGNTATGFYRLAKQFAVIFARVQEPLYSAVYPLLAQLVAQKNYERLMKLTFWFTVGAAGLGLFIWFIFLVFGQPIILSTVGSAFLPAVVPMQVYLFALVIGLALFPYQPLALSLGRHRYSLVVSVISSLVYFPILVGGSMFFGLIGAGFAFSVYNLVWLALMAWRLNSDLVKLKA